MTASSYQACFQMFLSLYPPTSLKSSVTSNQACDFHGSISLQQHRKSRIVNATNGRISPLLATTPPPTSNTSPSGITDVAVILLAGGSGKRMQADRPKQFLRLAGKTVLEHSITLFGALPEVSHIVVVLDRQYRADFEHFADSLPCTLQFADPGEERQDSVFNGLELIPDSTSLACVHDSARPLITHASIRDVLRDASEHGAAVLGVPSKATIKESHDGEFVLRTIPRSRLWEIQTPQVIRPHLLRLGFEKVEAEGLAVTDDVSIVEHLAEPVKITMGEYTNIKLTTPEDMNIAESILKDRQESTAVI